MRQLPVELTTYLNTRQGVRIHRLLWLKVKNRETGEIEEHGMWSGLDHREFVVDGVTRLYYGFGQFISWGDLKSEATLNIRTLAVTMPNISPEIALVLRQFDPHLAPAEVHLTAFSTDTNNLVSPPYKVFDGWIDTAPIKDGAKNGQGSAVINMIGHTRILTKVLAVRRSNESQNQRQAGDLFFKDVGITGKVNTPWGQKGVGQAAPMPKGGFAMVAWAAQQKAAMQ
jgi:hypothetical protein